jgi:hypothetical protein
MFNHIRTFHPYRPFTVAHHTSCTDVCYSSQNKKRIMFTHGSLTIPEAESFVPPSSSPPEITQEFPKRINQALSNESDEDIDLHPSNYGGPTTMDILLVILPMAMVVGTLMLRKNLYRRLMAALGPEFISPLPSTTTSSALVLWSLLPSRTIRLYSRF